MRATEVGFSALADIPFACWNVRFKTDSSPLRKHTSAFGRRPVKGCAVQTVSFRTTRIRPKNSDSSRLTLYAHKPSDAGRLCLLRTCVVSSDTPLLLGPPPA
jgi:hypothetical protein